MNNENIRQRMKAYTDGCRTSYAQIGREAGLGNASKYLISRFLKGLYLNDNTLELLDKYLKQKGY